MHKFATHSINKILKLLLVFGMTLFLGACAKSDSNSGSAAASSSIASAAQSSASTSSQQQNQQTSQAPASEAQPSVESEQQVQISGPVTLDQIPPYSGSPYIAINNNVPFFDANEKTADGFQHYFDLDSLGRVTMAYGSLGPEFLPTGKRGDISNIRPTGWVQKDYDFITDGGKLYNRCHLIAWSLSGQNDNPKNLMTGTRYFNIKGMTPFENMVRDYIKETGNHVMYRVTPMFQGDELVARGILIEGYSVEDNGEGIEFCDFVYNVQPGVAIDYATGESHADGTDGSAQSQAQPAVTYVLNTKTNKFHRPDCPSVENMSPENREDVTLTKEQVEAMGYEPCKRCNP